MNKLTNGDIFLAILNTITISLSIYTYRMNKKIEKIQKERLEKLNTETSVTFYCNEEEN